MRNKFKYYFVASFLVILLGILSWSLISSNLTSIEIEDSSTDTANSPESRSQEPYTAKITVGAIPVFVELANTPASRQQGLSGRRELPDGTGMLFIFDQPQQVSFWMPDMYIDLDMLFIRDNTIVFIEHDVPAPPLSTPRDQLEHYSPGVPVDMVLEVPAGWTKKQRVAVGDRISQELYFH